MVVRFKCPCGKKFKAPDDKIGKKILCSSCGNPVLVPEEDTVVVEDVAATASLRADELLRSGSKDGQRVSFGGFDQETAPENKLRNLLVDVGQEFGTKILPGIAAIAFLFFITYWLSNSVMKTSTLPDLVEVTGTITLDGQPLAGAHVIFEPIKTPDNDVKAAASHGLTDETGTFSLVYVKDITGAVVGMHRVEISARNEKGKERVPFQYNVRSTLAIEVKPDSEPLKFDILSN